MPNDLDRRHAWYEGECEGCPLSVDRRTMLVRMAAAAIGITAVPRVLAAITPLSAKKGGELVYPLPREDGAHIDHDNAVIVVRWENVVYAFNLSCPHQNTALRWVQNDKAFQCPRHHSRYEPNGTFISGRATRGMDRFPLRRDGESVLVDVDRMIKQSDDSAAWTAACVRLA